MPPQPPAPTQTAGSPCLPPNQTNLRVLLDNVGRGIRERLSSDLCDSPDWDPLSSNGSRLKKAILDAMYSFYSRRRTRRFSHELPFSEKLSNGHSRNDGDLYDNDEIPPIELLSPRPLSPCNIIEEKGSSDIAHETAVSKGAPVLSVPDVSVSSPRSIDSNDSAFNAECDEQPSEVTEEVSIQIALTSDGFRGQGIRPFSAPLDCILTAEGITSYIRRHWKHQASCRIQPFHLNLFDKLLGMYNQWTNPIAVSTLNILPDGRRLLQIEIIGLDLNALNSPLSGARPYSVPRRQSRQSIPPFKPRRESRNFDDMILI